MSALPKIFDHKLLQLRRVRSIKQGYVDFLKQRVEGDLKDRLSVINRDFSNAYSLSYEFLGQDEDLGFEPQAFDLVTSNLLLHSVNDLPGVLSQICRALRPDGLFLAAMLGGETLYELRDVLAQTEIELYGGVSPRVHPMADKPQMGALLQRANFNLPVVDSDIITVAYNGLFNLMHDLRGMAETNIVTARDKRYLGLNFFKRAEKIYKDKYCDDDGRIRASFEIIYLCGWAPHESQQKPSVRGSGQVHLTEVL